MPLNDAARPMTIPRHSGDVAEAWAEARVAYQPGGTGRHPPEWCAKLALSSPVSRSSRSGGRPKHLTNFWWAAEPVGPSSKPPPVRVRAACSRQRLVLDHPRLRRRLERPERWKACQRQVRAAQSEHQRRRRCVRRPAAELQRCATREKGWDGLWASDVAMPLPAGRSGGWSLLSRRAGAREACPGTRG